MERDPPPLDTTSHRSMLKIPVGFWGAAEFCLRSWSIRCSKGREKTPKNKDCSPERFPPGGSAKQWVPGVQTKVPNLTQILHSPLFLIVQIHERPPKSKGNQLPSRKSQLQPQTLCSTENQRQKITQNKAQGCSGRVLGGPSQPRGPAHLQGGRQGQGAPAALQQHRATHGPTDPIQLGGTGVVAIPPSQAAQPVGSGQEQVKPGFTGKLSTGQAPQDRKMQFKESYPGILVGSSGSCRGEKHRRLECLPSRALYSLSMELFPKMPAQE